MCEPLVLQRVGGADNVFPGRGNSWVEIALCPGNGAVSKQGWCSLISAGDAELGTGSVVDELLPMGMGGTRSCGSTGEPRSGMGRVFLHGGSVGYTPRALPPGFIQPQVHKRTRSAGAGRKLSPQAVGKAEKGWEGWGFVGITRK